MKNLTALLSLMVFSLTMIGQSETRNLEDFDQLRVSGSLDVVIHQGQPKANITMIRGDIEELQINQKGNKLHIKFRDRMNWSGKRKAAIELYVQNLEAIDVSAGAEVVSEFALVADEFYADASSGATLSIEIESKSLDADVSSGASIDIEGSADELNVDVSSGGSYNGKRLIAKDVDADVSSGGTIKVWATERLEADASSGGSIKYKGNPKSTDIDSGKWSGGSVKKI